MIDGAVAFAAFEQRISRIQLTKSSEQRILFSRGEIMSDIGDLIKEHRLACNLSQKKLGDACGISDAEIMRIENGDRDAKLEQSLQNRKGIKNASFPVFAHFRVY